MRRPPRSTRTEQPLPYTTLCRARIAKFVRRPARTAVGDEFDADQQAAPAHVADRLVLLLQVLETLLHVGAHLGRPRGEPVAHQSLDDAEADRRRQRIVRVRGEEQEALRVAYLLDLGAGHHRRQRQPRPQRSEEHTSELQSLMRISYAVFCL